MLYAGMITLTNFSSISNPRILSYLPIPAASAVSFLLWDCLSRYNLHHNMVQFSICSSVSSGIRLFSNDLCRKLPAITTLSGNDFVIVLFAPTIMLFLYYIGIITLSCLTNNIISIFTFPNLFTYPKCTLYWHHGIGHELLGAITSSPSQSSSSEMDLK